LKLVGSRKGETTFSRDSIPKNMDLIKVKDQVKGMDFKEIIQTQTTITGKNMSQATSQSNQQDAENLNKNGNGVRQICDKHGNTYLNYFNRFNYSFQANDIPQALESLTIADNQIFEWFQDTVTLAHMIRNDGKLQNLQTLHW
jgi:hypothetical protein